MKQKSPFKFLDPYGNTAEDHKIFFGRDAEVDHLYNLVFKTHLLMVYGQSGTGKTSLIQCGLGSKFDGADWFPFFIRRNENINTSFSETLAEQADGNLRKVIRIDQENITMVESIPETISYIYKTSLRRIYLIFDQFEELFILGSKEEQDEFVKTLSEILEADLPCKIILVMREEYLAQLYRFEQVIPSLMDRRLRVEPMTYSNVSEVITGSCKAYNITLENEKENVEQIIDQISGKKSGIQLPYLQIYLDKLWNNYVDAQDAGNVSLTSNGDRSSYPALTFTSKGIKKAGKIENVLEKFLKRQVDDIQRKIHKSYNGVPEKTVSQILDVFVTEDGTKRPALIERREDGSIKLETKLESKLKNIPDPALQEILSLLDQARILRMEQNQIELAHDSLADLIDKERTSEQRLINQIKQRIAAAYRENEQTGEFLSQRQLDSMEEYLPKLGLTPLQQAFIKDSYTDAERKEKEEEAHHQREVELAGTKEKMAAEERSKKKLRLSLAIIMILAITAIGGFGWAFWNWDKLRTATELNDFHEANELITEADSMVVNAFKLFYSDNLPDDAKKCLNDADDRLNEAESKLKKAGNRGKAPETIKLLKTSRKDLIDIRNSITENIYSGKVCGLLVARFNDAIEKENLVEAESYLSKVEKCDSKDITKQKISNLKMDIVEIKSTLMSTKKRADSLFKIGEYDLALKGYHHVMKKDSIRFSKEGVPSSIKKINSDGMPAMVVVEGGKVRFRTLRENGTGTAIKTFYMSKTEITNEQFVAFLNMGGINEVSSKSHWQSDQNAGIEYDESTKKFKVDSRYKNLPVFGVTFKEASAYCKWAGGSLPTEVQWEYAAKGGSKSKQTKFSGSDRAREVGLTYDEGEKLRPLPVGSRMKNEIELHDMTGNVWEWCIGREGSSRQPIRGGSMNNSAAKATVIFTKDLNSRARKYENAPVGFRLARN